jgi:hypothetical protein
LVGHIEGGTKVEGFRGKDAAGDTRILGYVGTSKGDWRRLHKEELHDMYFSPDILLVFSRRMRWAGHVAHMGERRGSYMVLVERPEASKPLGRGKLRLEDNNKMDL